MIIETYDWDKIIEDKVLCRFFYKHVHQATGFLVSKQKGSCIITAMRNGLVDTDNHLISCDYCEPYKEVDKEKYAIEKRINKPPLGLIPRKIWLQQREADIRSAMLRYLEAEEKIPAEWLDELGNLYDEIEECTNWSNMTSEEIYEDIKYFTKKFIGDVER